MLEAAPQATYKLSSVDRALSVLSILAIEPGMRLGELSERLGANSSTMLRALRVLEAHGLVRRSPSELEYMLGTRLVELGHAAIAAIDIARELRHAMRPLVAEFLATAHIGMVHTGMVTIVDKLDPPAPVVRYSTVGTRMPLHATAGGKAALALDRGQMLDELEGVELRRYTPRTIDDLPTLRRDIDSVRELRYSVEREEFHRGFGCVGSAVSTGNEIYTVSISGSLNEPDTLPEWGERLCTVIDELIRIHRGALWGL